MEQRPLGLCGTRDLDSDLASRLLHHQARVQHIREEIGGERREDFVDARGCPGHFHDQDDGRRAILVWQDQRGPRPRVQEIDPG